MSARFATPASLQIFRQAQDEHDRARRAMFEGVSDVELAAEHAHWDCIGAAIADLADLIRRRCAASAFCSTAPQGQALAARISEAIDDQLDAAAWRLVDAAARRHLDT